MVTGAVSGPRGGGAAMTSEAAGAAPIRVLMAKVGLDGHDRGVKMVARALRGRRNRGDLFRAAPIPRGDRRHRYRGRCRCHRG